MLMRAARYCLHMSWLPRRRRAATMIIFADTPLSAPAPYAKITVAATPMLITPERYAAFDATPLPQPMMPPRQYAMF